MLGNVMNITERKAHDWLLRQGFEDITFSKSSSPDFKCSDGSGFEAKKLYGSCILFNPLQFAKLRGMPNTKILVFSDEGINGVSPNDPVAVIPAEELEKDKRINGFKVTLIPAEQKATRIVDPGGSSIIEVRMVEVPPDVKMMKRVDYEGINKFLERGIPVFSGVDKKLAWWAKKKLERLTGKKVACFKAWFNKPGYVFIYESHQGG